MARRPAPFTVDSALGPQTRLPIAIVLAVILAAVILTFDLLTPLGVAGGVPYVAVVLIGLLARSPPTVLVFAAMATALTLVGYFISPDLLAPRPVVVLNRILAIFAIWAAAAVSYLHLKSMTELKPLADLDPLTGAYNRHYMTREVNRQISIWRRYHSPLSVIMLDIDHFKRINDRHGHLAGDAVLRALTRTLQRHAREIDTVCRYGGEEFLLLLPFTRLPGALAKARRIKKAISAIIVPWHHTRLRVRVSMGVVELAEAHWGVEELIAAADAVLYEAKAAGRNRIVAAPKPRVGRARARRRRPRVKSSAA